MEKGTLSVLAFVLAVCILTAAPAWMPMVPGLVPNDASKACGGPGKIWIGGACRTNDSPLEGTAL